VPDVVPSETNANPGGSVAASCLYCGGVILGSPRSVVGSERYCCYGCRVLSEGGRKAERESGNGGEAWFSIGFGAFVAAQLMLFATVVNVSEVEGVARGWIHLALALGACSVLWVLGRPLVRQACACVAERRAGTEWLFLLGIVGAMGASVHASLRGTGAVYYEVVAVLVTVYSAGKALTAFAKRRVLTEVESLDAWFGEALLLGPEGTESSVSVRQLRVGDLVRVRPGSSIAVDGLVRKGSGWVSSCILNGTSVPEVVRPGDQVRAGMISVDAEFDIEICQRQEGRVLDRLLGTVRMARDGLKESRSMVFADRFAGWFVLFVVTSALMTGWWWWIRGEWEFAVYRALSVVLIACPCAVGLAVPLGLWSGLAVAASRGVILRTAGALERLADVRNVWFDKTGTLTDSTPSMLDLALLEDSWDRLRVRRLVDAVESRSGHVLAKAFHTGCSLDDIEVRDVLIVPGEGVRASIREAAGRWMEVRIGRLVWLIPESAVTSMVEPLRYRPDSDFTIGIEIDGKVIGIASIHEQPKEGWPMLVTRLEALGCRVGVLTGDRIERAVEFGLGGRVRVLGGMGPDEKAEFLAAEQKKNGPVAFVGDGVNDGPALAVAAVGLAVSEGTTIAKEAGDGVIGERGLESLIHVIQVSRDVQRRIRSGLWFASGYNVMGMGLAAGGWLHPVVASLLMVISSGVVAWRSVVSTGDGCAPEDAEPSGHQRILFLVSLVLQIPMAAWLGAMSWPQVLGMAMGLWGVGWGLMQTSQARPWSRMMMGMLGPGGLGMLAGWCVEAGMGPVMREGVCLCCQPHHYFELTGKVPWMQLGMILGGWRWMWPGLPRLGRRLQRWPAGLLAATGMVVGMNEGARIALAIGGPGHPAQFLLAWVGMVVGMSLGMLLGCGVAEAWRAMRQR
jgi:heavy metal translocating P-type ATPase